MKKARPIRFPMRSRSKLSHYTTVWYDEAETRMLHELLSRDRGDGCDTGQPQGVGSEAYLNGTSQGPTPEDARKDGHILGRSK